jgi:hypothetical protein
LTETASPPAVDLVRIHIIGLELEVFSRASEHMDELLREFGYLSTVTRTGSVPSRLLDLVAELRQTYTPVTARTQAKLDEALARGDATVDLTFDVPPVARDACINLSRLLDEADDYCRAGDLLTLETPPEAVALRRWYLGQFVAQIDGQPPTPWPEAGPEST